VPLLIWIALLLAIALAAIVAMVTLRDAVVFVLAGGSLVATVVATLIVVRGELTQEESSPAASQSAPGRLAGGLATLAVVMLAVPAVVVSSDDTATSSASDSTAAAAQTVRDYVTVGALDRAGATACSYLTASEQRRVARLAGPHAVCRDAFSDTQPASTVPGSVHAIQALPVTTTVRDGQARVVLGRGSGTFSFELRHATGIEQLQFDSPPSEWRITAGAASVLAT
jgi:hypothetical protein